VKTWAAAGFHWRQLEFLLHQLNRSAGDADSDGEATAFPLTIGFS